MIASLRSRRNLLIAVPLAALPLVAAAVSAGGCGSSNPPPVVNPGQDSGEDAQDSTADSPSPDSGGDAIVTPVDTGTGDDASDGAAPADAAEAGIKDSGTPDVGPICDPDASVGGGTLVVSTPDPDLLGAVTPDELVIAWTSLPAGGPVVHWAERATPSDPFGAPQSLDPSFGPFPADHVGLSGDGLRLVFATPDQSQIVEVSRSARGGPFTAVTTSKDFVAVNPSGTGPEATPGIGPFASPAFSPDFGIWAYVQGSNGVVVTEALLHGEWETPPLLPAGLAPPASSVKTIIPTGWSSDQRTLFYWDKTAQIAAIAWFDRSANSLYQTLLLGSIQQYAYPSGDCANIYYSAPSPDAGSDPLDIFVAPRR